jgi:hypothetical protein
MRILLHGVSNPQAGGPRERVAAEIALNVFGFQASLLRALKLGVVHVEDSAVGVILVSGKPDEERDGIG